MAVLAGLALVVGFACVYFGVPPAIHRFCEFCAPGDFKQKFVHKLGKLRGQHLDLEYQDADKTTCSLVYCVPAKTGPFPSPDPSLSVEDQLKELQSRIDGLPMEVFAHKDFTL